MKHALVEYERNGYNDSDFFAIWFDDATGELGQTEIGSTRYAGGAGYEGISTAPASSVILERARKALAALILSQITAAEKSDVLEPESVPFGTTLRILKDSSPRSKSTYKTGEIGEVFYSKAFGTFYRKGYNTPDRKNTRVGLRRLDGTTVFVPLSQCRLDREMLTTEELNHRAEALSHEYQFGGAFAGYTWASKLFFATPEQNAEAAAA